MASAIDTRFMTTEELLSLPNDGVDRWLIDGQLREKRPEVVGEMSMTIRNRLHSRIMAAIAAALRNWRDRQPDPKGDVVCGEAGIRLARNPDTTVGVDVAYISPDVVAAQSDDTSLIEGIPLLAVEILSPSDTNEEINEKIDKYLEAGVPLLWIVDPRRRTATVIRPNTPIRTVNENEELVGEEVLPGFGVLLGELFR